MFSALISFLGGNAFRLVFGEIVSFLNEKQDYAQEVERMKLQADLEAAQHARNLEAIETQADLGVKTIQVQADAAVGQIEAGRWVEAAKATAAKSGIAWTDGWNAVIRPGVATCTLRKRVNAADWEAVPAELRKWNKCGGRILKGLTIRREAEAALV